MPTPVMYNQFCLKQNNGNAIDLDGTGIKVMLVTASYTPNQAHDFIDDADANEVTGSNYTADGEAIANPAIALDSNTVEWTHDDVVWAQHASGFTNARYAIWYHDTGTPATSKLIMYMDLGGDKGNQSGPLTLDVNPATGVVNVTHTP